MKGIWLYLTKKLVAKADYDQVKYNFEKAKANLKTAQAGFDKARVNLSYALIYSPISGVVLNRAVDQGQTVAASFSTPNLFTIGSDLTKMQVQANVDEADIGQVKKDQPVTFTVDAYPAETFTGDVRQVRLQPVVTSNVVTYTVIVNAPNPDKKLMPGMTANMTVVVQKIDSVLILRVKLLGSLLMPHIWRNILKIILCVIGRIVQQPVKQEIMRGMGIKETQEF